MPQIANVVWKIAKANQKPARRMSAGPNRGRRSASSSLPGVTPLLGWAASSALRSSLSDSGSRKKTSAMFTSVMNAAANPTAP